MEYIKASMIVLLLAGCDTQAPSTQRPSTVPVAAREDTRNPFLAEFDEDIALIALLEQIDSATVRQLAHDYLRTHDFIIAVTSDSSGVLPDLHPRTADVLETVDSLAAQYNLPVQQVARVVLEIRRGQATRAAIGGN